MMYSKLKEIRYKNKLSAQDVALKVGISKAFYCQLENCKRYDMALRIANVFKVKPDYLFYDDAINNLKKNI